MSRYDAVRIHSARDDGLAPWMPEEDAKLSQGGGPENGLPPEVPPRPRGKPKAWADGARDEQAWQTMEERLRQAQDKKVYETRRKTGGHGATFKQDEEGMNAAYSYRSYPGAAYDENTETLYVAGSDSWRSWYDDFVNIPI